MRQPLRHIAALEDLRAEARTRLDRATWDFLEGGSSDERALRRNECVRQGIAVIPRVCAQVGSVTTKTEVLGQRLQAPLIIAPVAYQGMFHDEGERATARAAAATGVGMTTPMLSSAEPDASSPLVPGAWYQSYWLRDREATSGALQSAEECGYSGVMLTLDTPRMARRHRDLRNRFAPNARTIPGGLLGDGGSSEAPLVADSRERFGPAMSWDDVRWVKDRTRVPILVKGVLHPDDARAAVAAGSDAIVVSNHGGRQFGIAPAALEVLPAVRQAVGPAVPIIVDGCIRTGEDILAALALGADAVMIGRPAMWGLAVAGKDGVEWVIRTLMDELESALHLAGCDDCAAARDLAHLPTIGYGLA